MKSGAWNKRVFERIIELARWYASGDNCQPFRFAFCKGGIEVSYKPEVAKHHLNPGEVASSISSGFLIELLRRCALQEGWRLNGNLVFERLHVGGVCGFLSVSPCEPISNAAEGLLRRRTSRRPYLRNIEIKDNKVINSVNRVKSGSYRARIIANTNLPLMRTIASCDEFLASKEVAQELIRHTHLKARSKTGFLPSNLNLNWIDQIIFALAKVLGPKWGPLLFAGPGRKILAHKGLANLKSTPHLLLVSGPKPQTLEDWSHVGRCAQIAWGELAMAGFCAQPLSAASLVLPTFAAVNAQEQIPATDRKNMECAAEALSAGFQLMSGEVPLWLFRVGQDGLDLDPDRLRLNLNEITEPSRQPETREQSSSRGDQRIVRRLFNLLPSQMRHFIYRAMARVPVESLSDRFTVEIASTKGELKSALSLLHDCYVQAKLMEANRSGIRADQFILSPHTTTIVVKDRGQIIGSVSLIRDSDVGLPSDAEYKEQNDLLRKKGQCLVEISALAVGKGYRRPSHFVSLLLMKYLFNFCKINLRSNYLVCVTHPRAEDFYRALFGFKRLGPVKAYGSVQRALAIHLSMSMTDSHMKHMETKYPLKRDSRNLPMFLMTQDLRFVYPPKNKEQRIYPVLSEAERLELQQSAGVDIQLPAHQRKREFRTPVFVKARIQIGSEIEPAQILDISSGGCFVKISERLIGESRNLKIYFNLNGRSFKIPAKIIWNNNTEARRLPGGVGLKFLAAVPELSDSIREIQNWHGVQSKVKTTTVG